MAQQREPERVDDSMADCSNPYTLSHCERERLQRRLGFRPIGRGFTRVESALQREHGRTNLLVTSRYGNLAEICQLFTTIHKQ